MDKFMQATPAYINSVIYPDTGRTIAQTLLGRWQNGSLPAISGFYQPKKEFLMERKEHEIFDKGSRVLSELAISDRVRIQNQTMLRKIR